MLEYSREHKLFWLREGAVLKTAVDGRPRTVQVIVCRENFWGELRKCTVKWLDDYCIETLSIDAMVEIIVGFVEFQDPRYICEPEGLGRTYTGLNTSSNPAFVGYDFCSNWQRGTNTGGGNVV